MCGRFERHSELEDFTRLIQEPVMADSTLFGIDRNIFPGSVQPIIRKEEDSFLHATGCRWGLTPSWVTNPRHGKPINARIETVTKKPMFRSAIRQRRCIVPCNGFYEWQKLPNEKKQPFHISLSDNAPFFMAGIWEHNRKLTSIEVESFAILTTEANTAVASIHDRMPVVISPEILTRWLDVDGDCSALLKEVGLRSATARFQATIIAKPGA